MKIFLDMDEVLVDFEHGVSLLHGTTKEAVYQIQPPNVWEIASSIGRLTYKWEGVDLDRFWEPVHSYPDGEAAWWAGLNPMPWALEFYERLIALDSELFIVSSPSRNPDSRRGKLDWIQRHFPNHDLDRVFFTRHKTILSAPGRLLIDDRLQNCVDWISVGGGSAIRFPSGPTADTDRIVTRIIDEMDDYVVHDLSAWPVLRSRFLDLSATA